MLLIGNIRKWFWEYFHKGVLILLRGDNFIDGFIQGILTTT
jgi:hypothetical protein